MKPAVRNMLRSAAVAAQAAAIVALGIASAAAGTIDTVRKDKALRIAYREDAPPFSFKDPKGEPAGFMVDLCRAVAHGLSAQLDAGELKIVYVPVTATDRFDAIEKGRADLLCEATSDTLSRREAVGFSIATFVDGASVLTRSDGPSDFSALAGRKIGVLAGTTTETTLRNSLTAAGINADVMPAKTHADGLAMLDKGSISAYFADHAILMYLAAHSSDPANLRLADNYLTLEPYGLALPRGDEDFRLAVDRALSRIYRSGEIEQIFSRNFGMDMSGAGLVSALYAVTALPE